MIHIINLDSKHYSTVMGDITQEYHSMKCCKENGEKKEAKKIKASLNQKVQHMGLNCADPACKCPSNMKFYSIYVRGVDYVESADLELYSDSLEIVRVQCDNCNKTHALLPYDLIPYCCATADTVLLTELSRQSVNEELAQSEFFAEKSFPEKPVVISDGRLHVPTNDIVSASDYKTLRKDLIIENGKVMINGTAMKVGVINNFTDSEGATISLSTVYHWGKALVDEAHNCFCNCVDVLRGLDIWNKGRTPSLGELCGLLLTHPFNKIQEELITRHICPFLFRLSRRTVSGFPYTGFAYCIY